MIDCQVGLRQLKQRKSQANLEVQSSLNMLQKLMKDKLTYTIQTKQAKMNRKLKQAKQNFKTYLKTHEQMPKYLLEAERISGLISDILRKQKFKAFKLLKNRKLGTIQKKQIKPNYSDLKVKLKQPLIKMISHLGGNRKLMNEAFSRIKSWNKKRKAQVDRASNQNKEKNQQNIQEMRLFQFTNTKNTKDDKYDIKFNEHSFADSLMQVDVSNLVDMTLIEKSQRNFRLKEDLMNKINSLQAQFHQSIRKYSDIRYNIQNLILEANSEDFSRAQNLWDSQSKKDFSQHMKQQPSQNNCIQLSKDQSQKIASDKQAIIDFLSRYQELNDQVDQVRANIEHLLQISSEESNVNPNIISILSEAKRILMPNPLGLVRQ